MGGCLDPSGFAGRWEAADKAALKEFDDSFWI
jgi:hypothetical protein